jgi:hypothetical protein
MIWIFACFIVAIILGMVALLMAPQKKGRTSSYALERRNTSLAHREIRYENRGNEALVHISSSRPMRRVQIYIRTGIDHMFGYRIDDDEE